jgi:hypothetical protein
MTTTVMRERPIPFSAELRIRLTPSGNCGIRSTQSAPAVGMQTRGSG